MAFTVPVKVTKRFKVQSKVDDVFDVLANVPESAGHFPKVRKLVDLGDNTYRWEMEKLGLDRYFIQTVYTSKYRSDRGKGTVTWEPVEGAGNAMIAGNWKLKALDAGGTQCALTVKGELTVPLPALVKILLTGLVESEFRNLIDDYAKNLRSTFNA